MTTVPCVSAGTPSQIINPTSLCNRTLLFCILITGLLFLASCNADDAVERETPLTADIDNTTTEAKDSDTVVTQSAPGGTDATGGDSVHTGMGMEDGDKLMKKNRETKEAAEAGQPVAVDFATTVTTTDKGPGEATPSGISHSTFGTLLSKSVSGGRINYNLFRNNADFQSYLTMLAGADLSSLTRNEKLAFWVNAYNALVIRNVLDNPGLKKPTDVPGFFDGKTFVVAGRKLTLNGIENDIVRPTFKEPLIHFGLVCAALSCPPIIPEAYTGKNVRSKLAANAREYLASDQNRFDPSTGTLYLSKIFEWYKVDFGGNDAGLISFAKKYGPASMQEGLAAAGNPTVAFLEYDWTLNAR